jgi:hypothetical protein
MDKKVVVIVGYGSVGQYALDMIMRDQSASEIEKIYVLSRRPRDEVEPRLNVTRVSAGIIESYVPIVYYQTDLNNIELTAYTLRSIGRIDLVLYCGRYMSGIKYGAYSYPNKIGYGVWIPMSLVLITKFMKALNESGIKGALVVNTSYPDGVNEVLCKNKLCDHQTIVGAGNLDHLIPRIKLAVSKISRTPSDGVSVYLVGSHYLNTYVSKDGDPKGSPYMMKILAGSESKIADSIVFQNCKIPMNSDHVRNMMVASDVSIITRIVVSELTGYESFIHVPGPNGLPGGYPCVYDADSKEFIPALRIFQDVNNPLAAAIKCNKAGMYLDGIEVQNNGDICFSEASRYKLKNVFDINAPELISLDDCESYAEEIAAKLTEYDLKKSKA